eukprot:TRINITY_DN7849_c0_g1_i1.p1 TRINITY_DN7849_c0_g1~~TRINITY_DN7849_c0_g1_i1.p1  ORF type:complete len:420 (-),score=45.55 TRINITY_DN7849_c0_g1_i1:26-1285(-)
MKNGVGVVIALFIIIVLVVSWPSHPSAETPKCTTKHIQGTSGKLFHMKRLRAFDRSVLTIVDSPTNVEQWKEGRHCDKWAVTTTIFEPSKTVQQIAQLKGWCVVVVLDLKTPKYDVPGAVVLTVDWQRKLPYRIVRRTPWNHFGRKNIGFLYAIAHGAKVIYDCDDDNELIVEQDEEKSIPLKVAGVIEVANTEDFYNPYPHYGNEGGWPRGFPLEMILNTSLMQSQEIAKDLLSNTYVYQSLANNDPDYDAIYRLTRRLPVTFQNSGAVILPTGTYAPYNAQATLHFPKAFWGLILPITVHGRVSDIWRGYFTQRLFEDIGGHLLFQSPWVVQYRNAHNYLADFDSELELYQRSSALVLWLKNRWSPKGKTLQARILELAIAMYEHGIIEEDDVILTRDWILDLESLGYEFPAIIPGH